jgi:hypothetical protein
MFGTADVAQFLLRGALEPVDAPLFQIGEHRKHFSMGVLQTGIIEFDMTFPWTSRRLHTRVNAARTNCMRYQARSSTSIFLPRAAKLNSVATRCCRYRETSRRFFGLER